MVSPEFAGHNRQRLLHRRLRGSLFLGQKVFMATRIAFYDNFTEVANDTVDEFYAS